MATNDIYALSIRGTVNGSQTINTLAFKQLSATAGDTRITLAQDWDTNIMPSWVSGISNQWSVVDYSVRDVVPGTGAEVVVAPAAARVGNDVSDPLPPSDAMVFTLRTTLKGRSFRGRVYWGGMAESSQSGGLFTSAWVANRTAVRSTIFGRYITNAATTGYQIGVISTVSNGIPRPSPVFTPLFDIQVQPRVRTIRRRQIGVGS